jgi:penicillin-binding protein 1A
VINSGTGARARIGGYDLAGKTGTTSDYKDAWFIGFTGGFTAAVWVGRDDSTPMRRVTGGGAPAEIWRSFMTAALPRLKAQAIPGGTALPATVADTGPPELSGAPPPDAEAPDGQADQDEPSQNPGPPPADQPSEVQAPPPY